MISDEKLKWLSIVDTSIGQLESIIDHLRGLYGAMLLEDYPGENNDIQILADKLSMSITRKLEVLTSEETCKGWLENDIKLTDIRKEIANLKD